MKYYLVGIKGAGLSALALILYNLGYKVSGYDDEKKHQFTEDKLKKVGIKIYTEENNELTNDTIVIRSTAISEDHREIKKALEMNLKIYEYMEFLGELSKQYHTIAISGTHGKTTTTSMLKEVINNTLGCNYLVGDGDGYAFPDNKYFLIEACEYRRNFLYYFPKITIITNVDLDHVDYYKDISDVQKAFEELGNKTTDLVVIYGDEENSRNLKINTSKKFYGLNENNDVYATNIKYDSLGIHFDVYIDKKFYYRFDLPLYGEHILLNSLAVITVCNYLKIPNSDIQNYLNNFKGAARRFNETVINNSIIIDDYAHHPKEVEVTIKAIRQKYPKKNVVAVFEPHTFSRTKMFAKKIADALNLADEVYVLDIFKSRENQEDYPEVTNKLIINNLKNGHHLERDSKILHKYNKDVVIFMSPKEISDIQEDLVDHLR